MLYYINGFDQSTTNITTCTNWTGFKLQPLFSTQTALTITSTIIVVWNLVKMLMLLNALKVCWYLKIADVSNMVQI